MKLFKKVIESAGLNYKKEIRKLALILLAITLIAGVIIGLFGKPIHLLLLLGIDVTICLVFYIKYQNLSANKKFAMQREFVKLFTYFEIYIYNGINVYKSLQELMNFASATMKDHLEILVAKIDEDKTVSPFLEYAKKFDSLIIEQTMISIFQMIDQGSDGLRIIHFQNLFGKIAEQYYDDEIAKARKSFDSLNVLPLLGAGIITMMITVGIVFMIGDMVGGF
ncbi:MAG: hypothetical protein WC282_00325 [Bacilli bacterium]|jgi:hypothetical protein